MRLEKNDIGMLMVCAIRYCHGRQTYMPTTIQKIVLNHLDSVDDKHLKILLDDCKFQGETNNYGDVSVDKPSWLKYRDEIQKEYDRRMRNGNK